MSDSDTEWLSVGSPSPIPADVSKHNPKRDIYKVDSSKVLEDHCETSSARNSETNGPNSVIRNTRNYFSTSFPENSTSFAPPKDHVIVSSAIPLPIRKDGIFGLSLQTTKSTRSTAKTASSSLDRTSDAKDIRSAGSAPVSTEKKRPVPDKMSTEPKSSHDPKIMGSHIGPVAFGQQLSLGSLYLRQCASLLNSSLVLQTNESLGLGLLPILDHNIKESIIRMVEIKNQLKEVQDFLKTVVDESVAPYPFSPYVGEMSNPAVINTVFHNLNETSGSIVSGRPISRNNFFHPYIRP